MRLQRRSTRIEDGVPGADTDLRDTKLEAMRHFSGTRNMFQSTEFEADLKEAATARNDDIREQEQQYLEAVRKKTIKRRKSKKATTERTPTWPPWKLHSDRASGEPATPKSPKTRQIIEGGTERAKKGSGARRPASRGPRLSSSCRPPGC